MYKGFQLEISPYLFERHLEAGERLYARFRKEVEPALDHYILSTCAIDAGRLMENWFPQTGADIFISHAHADRDLAVSLAGWLHDHFGLTAFVDSCIWGHSDHLLRILDERYCRNSETTFSYESRNITTTHVHSLLQSALAQMMDRCECLFFLKTERSTLAERVSDHTQSAWIYVELSLSRLIRVSSPARLKTRFITELKSRLYEMERKLPEFEYPLELRHLIPLNNRDLTTWLLESEHVDKGKTHPLDTLYQQKK